MNKKWCEHINLENGVWRFCADESIVPDPYVYCFRCGKPRPKELTLEEKLAEFLTEDMDYIPKFAQELASKTLAFLREKGSLK